MAGAPPGERSSRVESPHVKQPGAQPGSSSADHPDSPVEPPTESVRKALSKIAELEAYAREYFAARGDQFKLSVRHAIFQASALLLALMAITAGLAIALVMLFVGLSGAIGAALGGRIWAGNLIVGGGLLLLVAVGTFFGLMTFRNTSRRATVKKYELGQKKQRQRFGRSSRDRSAAAGKVDL